VQFRPAFPAPIQDLHSITQSVPKPIAGTIRQPKGNKQAGFLPGKNGNSAFRAHTAGI